jgi:enoyl-CoA hydratase/carnithine racemase
MPDGLRVERAAAVAWCTLDRPPLNILDPGLVAALHDVFHALAADATVRVAILTAAGRAFSAGMDVRVLRDFTPATARQFISDLHEAIEAVHHAPFPVIAAVHGACLGAGLEIALACDVRLAASDASFGLPEVRVGVPSVIEAALLPAIVGPGRAAELLLTGDAIDAERARAWGLVNRVVEPAELRSAAAALADRILGCGPQAIRLQKALMLQWRYADLEHAIRQGVDVFARAYDGHEPAEGARAFLEKRAPKFEDAR